MEDKFEWRRHRRGNLGAVILVTVGVVLLLNNLEILPWSVWSLIWRLWPLLIIMAGIQMVFGHSRWGALIVNLLYLLAAFFVVLVLLSSTNPDAASSIKNFLPWLPNLNSYSF